MEFPEYVRHAEVSMWGSVTETDAESGRFWIEWQNGEREWVQLSEEGAVWVRMLDRVKVAECLAAVKAWAPDASDANMYVPGFHSDAWVIAMEEGPYEWPMLANHEDTGVKWPDGVFTEPLNHWAMCLYVGN